MGEHLAPKKSHRWLILEVDEKVVMFEKDKVGFNTSNDFGDIFLDYLPTNSIGYKILQRTHADIMTMRIEWRDDIEVVVNPLDNPELVRLFTSPWDEGIYKQFLPQRSLGSEAMQAMSAFGEVVKSVVKSKVLSRA
jgi:hypothetical protein